MYEQFYGLSGKPFHLSPDPKFFFESSGHARALAYLNYGVEQGEGFVVVTGDVGTGKTTLARMLYEELERSRDMVVAHLTMTQCSANDLLRMVADGFGIKHERKSKASLLKEIEAFLRKQHAEGKRTLLLIDEAQNLPLQALETLRMLSNFQVDDQSLLQSLLLGQAEFRDRLLARNMKQLRQRVIASCHLQPLNEVAETRAYIEHRLHHVDWQGDPAITEEAYATIQSYTLGVPRRINTFCDRLLLFAFLEELHEITAATVDAVAEDISSDFPLPSHGAARGNGSGQHEGAGEGAGRPAGDERLEELEDRVRVLERALQATRDGIDGAMTRDG